MFAQISDHKGKWPIRDTSDMFVVTEKNAITELMRQDSSWDDILVKAWGWLTCSFLPWRPKEWSRLCVFTFLECTYSIWVIWNL